MKRIKLYLIALITLFITGTSATNAQRFFYVDSEYILENIPEYKDAQQKLDQLSINWQKDIEAKYATIEKLYNEFQAEQILLTEDMKRKREKAILDKEKEVKEFQKQKFGFEGELFRKKQELVKPIQDKIYGVIKKIASEQNYAVVFDKSSDLIFLFSNPKYDKSDEVLRKLGYRANADDDAETGGTNKGGSTDRKQ